MLSNLRNNARTVKSRVIDQREATMRRLKELYREGGIREVFRGVRDYYQYNVADTSYHEDRVDNEHRWSLIEPHLDPDDEFLVDLGCADGFFVAQAASAGLNVLGIEGNQNRVERTRERFASADGVEVRQMFLSPDNVEEIPPADVVLFLTVHHHWVWQYGWEEAAEMFRIIADRADVMVYEPPGTKAIREGKQSGLDVDESADYYRDVLDEIFGDSVEILDCEMVAYTGGKRSDPFFVLDTSGV